MTIKSIELLLSQAATTLADNTTGAISASDVRDMVIDFIDSIAPAYGAIHCTSVSVSVTATPQVIAPFTSNIEVTSSYFTTNLSAGQVTRLVGSAGLPSALDFIVVNGSVAAGNNSSITVALFKNGSPTLYAVTVTGRGSANPVAFNLAGLALTDGAGAAVYELRVSGETTTADITNLALIAQAQPVRSYP
jgi:hypothetical protein